MKDRILELRKKLGLTQTEFGAKIGLTRDGVASYERGVARPTGTAIQCIILTYNVRREWLETGEGEMFQTGPVDYLDKLAAQHRLGPGGKALLKVATRVIDELDDQSASALLDRLILIMQDAAADRDAEGVEKPSAESSSSDTSSVG